MEVPIAMHDCISDEWLAEAERFQTEPHEHLGTYPGDPVCAACFAYAYEVGMADAAYVYGVAPEWIKARLAGPYAAPDRPARRTPPRYYLYRLYGVGRRLLYVGITRNLPGRLSAHGKAWGDVIHEVEHEEHADHRSVLAAEAAEIATKCPPFNSAGVGA